MAPKCEKYNIILIVMYVNGYVYKAVQIRLSFRKAVINYERQGKYFIKEFLALNLNEFNTGLLPR